MTHLTEMIADTAANARQALQGDKVEAALSAKVTKHLARQEHRLDLLETRVKDLASRRQGGGFPWLLLLIVGGAYALYRTNPSVQDQVKNLLGQADPGVKGNLARAGESAKDAVQARLHGNDPHRDLKDTASELGRAGEKTVNKASDKVDDLEQNVNRKMDDQDS